MKRKKLPPMIAGERHNRLTAVEFVDLNKFKMPRWKFRCDCGVEVMALVNQVRMNNTKSCGCLKRDMLPFLAQRTRERNTTHGKAGSLEYLIWNQMIMRCYNPAVKAYPYYGGRGIKVCDRWRKFENFYADMFPRPSSEHSIDRIDNKGDYCPENCKWATRREQGTNKRNNIIVELNGEKMCLAEASRRTGIKAPTIRRRLSHHNWTMERALTEPVGQWRRK